MMLIYLNSLCHINCFIFIFMLFIYKLHVKNSYQNIWIIYKQYKLKKSLYQSQLACFNLINLKKKNLNMIIHNIMVYFYQLVARCFVLLRYLLNIFLISSVIYLIVVVVSDSINEKRFWCPNKCGKNYKHKKNMRTHYLHECGFPPQFVCIMCTKIFRRNEHLKKHLLLIHKLII